MVTGTLKSNFDSYINLNMKIMNVFRAQNTQYKTINKIYNTASVGLYDDLVLFNKII